MIVVSVVVFFFFFFNHPTSDEIEILDAMIDHNGLNLPCELV